MRPGFHFLVILISGLFLWNPVAGQTDFTLDGTHVIPSNTTETYNNVYLDTNDDSLRVEGTLVVYGNLEMNGNKSRFSMGENAFVLVYGDFKASNLVDISVSSYLIIQGSFIRGSNSDKDNLNIDNANIYIFGDVEGWPNNFQSCNDYDGNTEDRANEECDFGTEESFENNIETFPPEIAEKLNCYDLSGPLDTTACVGSSATFSIDPIDDVTYKWQYRESETDDYISLSETSSQLTITGISANMDGYQYRVIVKPTVASGSPCKITISEPASLFIEKDVRWTGASSTNWNEASNWFCGQVPDINSRVVIPADLPNYPVIIPGDTGEAGDLNLEMGASIEVQASSLEISGNITSAGTINAAQGTLILSGNVNQNLPANLFLNNEIRNLEINNPAGVVSNTEMALSGWLKLSNGDLETNDLLSLTSNASQTALIDGSGTGNIIGAVSMQRYLDPATGYKYFSSPFNNTLVGDFSTYIDLNSNFPRFYRYNENREDAQGNDATGWQAYTNLSSTLNIMQGYAANFGNGSGPLTLTLTGQVNTGSYQLNLANNNGVYTKGFHLVGNPYPSPIDWESASGWTKTNIANAIYFFNATDEFTGTYSSYVNGVGSSGSETSVIPSMQGFFVQVTSGSGSGVLGVTNDTRVNNFSQSFYKSRKNKDQKKGLLRLTTGFEDANLKDALVIYFDFNSSKGFETDKDAVKLMNTNSNVPNFYFPTSEGEKLSINAIPEKILNSEELIPLGLEIHRDGKLIISLKDLKNLDGSTRVFLLDRELSTITELNKSDYSFQGVKGEYSNRFYLSFLPVDFDEHKDLLENNIIAVSHSNSIAVRMSFLQEEKGLLEIRTIDGKLISSKKVSTNEETWFGGIKSSGIYLVSFRTPRETITKKVIVK